MEGFLRSCRAPEITDIKKAFDQTVRDLKREVNKVLKVPEIEQKVLDATSNEPWGPHGTIMSEIAQATRNYQDYQLIVGVLWRRLGDTGRNWRHVYKALTVMEFIVAHGSEKAVEDLAEHVFQIQGLVDFQYEEPNGKDQGVNVRKKAETMIALLSDKEKIREAREKAASNKNKYQGISSSGSKYRSSGMGFSDWNDDKYDSNSRYNGKDERFGAGKNVGRYDESDRYRDDSRGSGIQRDGEDHLFSRVQSSPPRQKERPKSRDVKQAAATPLTTLDDDDDFNPRATSAPPPPPPPPPAAAKVEMDLFGDADFFSATPAATSAPLEDLLVGQSVQSVPPKPKPASDLFAADLFASAPSTAVSGDPFAGLSASSSADLAAFSAAPVKTNQPVADPFADPFGAFESGPKTTQSDLDDSSFGAFQSSAEDDVTGKQQPQKQEQVATGMSNTFQTKSSIWSDPLTSELINLNITAPKATALADVGIQFQNDDWSFEDKKPQQAAGKAMGAGSGLGLAGASIFPPPGAAARKTDGTVLSSYDFFDPVVPSNTGTTKTTNQQDPFAAFALRGCRSGSVDLASSGMD